MDKVVAFIPLRGGSKSIPNKNIKLIAGKPLAHWVIEAAVGCEYIDKVYVATDSLIIKDSVKPVNSTKLSIISRSAESATDTATTEVALLQFCEEYKFDYIFLIQATSPLLSAEDLSLAFKALKSGSANSILSVVKQRRFIWDKDGDFAHSINYDYVKRPRRQDFDGYFVENGAFYLSTRQDVLTSRNRISGNISFYQMDEASYYEIDEIEDWDIVEDLLNKRLIKNRNKILIPKLRKIKLLATDVDGVLTDAGMYYSESGDELKKFNTKDGKGLEMLRSIGIKIAIITTEDTQIVARRAEKLKVDYLFQGSIDKVSIIKQLSDISGLALEEIAFIGDDLNDFHALQIVGFSAAPADACSENTRIVDYVCFKKGGEGCVRELSELIIKSRSNV